jgi:hypothetical protein
MMGSLNESSNGLGIGPVSNHRIAYSSEDVEAAFPGPLSSTEHCYREIISRILRLITTKEMYSPWAIDAYLIHRYLSDLVPSLPNVEERQFYLRTRKMQVSILWLTTTSTSRA